MTGTWTPRSAPSACRHCGIDQRDHYQQWTIAAGWHLYSPPDQAQIKQRMRARRLAQLGYVAGSAS